MTDEQFRSCMAMLDAASDNNEQVWFRTGLVEPERDINSGYFRYTAGRGNDRNAGIEVSGGDEIWPACTWRGKLYPWDNNIMAEISLENIYQTKEELIEANRLIAESLPTKEPVQEEFDTIEWEPMSRNELEEAKKNCSLVWFRTGEHGIENDVNSGTISYLWDDDCVGIGVTDGCTFGNELIDDRFRDVVVRGYNITYDARPEDVYASKERLIMSNRQLQFQEEFAAGLESIETQDQGQEIH